jgi:predicted O-methyltransferase YrrM
MKPDELKYQLMSCSTVPHDTGLVLYDLVRTYTPRTCMELGSTHKASCAYIASALQETARGLHLVLDHDACIQKNPALFELLERADLNSYIRTDFAPASLHWKLMKLLETHVQPMFDLCLVDGTHTWSSAGLSVTLATQLLAPNGWLIISDLGFCYAGSSLETQPYVQQMSEEEKLTPQVDKVVELLVQRNPFLHNFFRVNGLACAQKTEVAWGMKMDSGDIITARSTAIGKARDLARYDPDFRRQLLDSPTEMLSAITQAEWPSSWKVSFHDRSDQYPVLTPQQRQECHIVLPEPRWQAATSEEELEKLFNAAQR